MFTQIFIFLLIIYKSISLNHTNSSYVIKTFKVFNTSSPEITNDSKTYFFKYDMNNQQFRVSNRVRLSNVTAVKNLSEPLINEKHIGNLERSNMNELRKLDAFLDDEWNYSSRRVINSTDIPIQIYPFLYNSIVAKISGKVNSNDGKLFPITRIIFNKKNNKSMILNFNLRNIKQYQHIENAELHFYWTVSKDSNFHKNSCVLRLYEVDGRKNDSYAEKNPDMHKLLNVIYASQGQTGWQMFRINKKSIESWNNATEELKLLISLSLANQVNSTTVFDDTLNESKWRTFLILKIKDEENNEDITIAPAINSTVSHSTSYKYCSRKEFYIDFQKLFWNNFIIAPDGFMAYDCHGKCTKHNTDNFSNHLKMLSTFQDTDKRIRAPCCVPIQFYSLPIMFYDKFGNIVIKIYDDLVVSKCGCR